MPRRRHRRTAPPKPNAPACPYCDGAFWAYNGWDWYPGDRATRRRHVCQSSAAVEARRLARAALDEQRARGRRSDTRQKVVAWVAGIAILVGGGVAYERWGTEPDYHGPPDATAECNDGWISYAQHHQGACSHHGGVHAWNH